jgi:SAM-dependent methyltransferase
MTEAASDFARARGYDFLMGRWSALLARELIRFIELEEVGSVLDVGCGTGSLTAAILATTRATAVVGVDTSRAFIEEARRRVRDPRVRFEIGDAQRLPFPGASFDAAASMLVFNFIPHAALATIEMRRVTRADGVVAACVWDYGGGMTMLRWFWDAAVALDPSVAALHERHMPLCRPGELLLLWRASGLQGVREGAIDIQMHFSSFDDYWKPFLEGIGPAGRYAMSLPRAARQALESKLRADYWGDAPSKGLMLPARAWAVAGMVPVS